MMNNLKKAIKQAVTESSSKWKATKIWDVKVEQSIYDEEHKTGEMIIRVAVRAKPKKN